MHHCQGKAKMMKDGQLFRVIDSNCWDPEVRIKNMDETGVKLCTMNTYFSSYWIFVFRCDCPSAVYCTSNVQLLG